MKKLIILLLFYLSIVETLLAQVYSAKHYGLKEGLPNSFVTQIFQDTQGNIWFTTSGGFTKFNGSSFKNFGLDNGLQTELVRCITADLTGKLFVGTTGNGVYKLVKDTLISICSNSLPKEIYAIKGDKYGHVWVATDKGLYQITSDENCINYTKKLNLPEGLVTHISEDKQGNIWFGYDEYIGLFKLELPSANIVQQYDSTNGFTSGRILSSFHDSKNNTWITTFEGLYVIKNNQKNATKINHKDIPNFYLYEIVEPKEGLLLIGSHEEGIIFYDTKTNQVIKKIGSKNGLKAEIAFRLFQDVENNIWVSSWGMGVSRLNLTGWSKIDENTATTSKLIYNVIPLNNGVMYSASDGIVAYNNRKSTPFYPEFIKGNIFVSFTDENIIFCAKQKSLLVFDVDKRKLIQREEEYLKGVRGITKSKDGKIYFASWGGGISVYENGQFSKITDSIVTKVNHYYCAYTSSDGRVWFGSWEGGVVYFDGNSWKRISTENGLPSNKVTAISEDFSNNMVFGTNGGGVVIFKDNQAKIINHKNKLLTNSVFSIICDSNSMWIGCQGGVSRYDLQTGKIKNYDYSTGFDGDCLLGSMTKKDNILWVGTTNSLWKFDEKDVLKTNISLKTIIEAVNVNNSPIEQTQNVFSYSENKFRFEYYTSQMYQNEKVLFQYRLIGVDTAFSSFTNQKEVSYIELPAGKYTFEIKACLDDVCSLENASYSFKILPPFWKTWWFRLLSGLTIVMLFYLFYRLRTETLRKRQAELERMVEIRTFEVVQEKKEVERQKHLVDEKNKEITDSITYAKRIQEAILPSRYSLSENLQNGFILFKPKDIVSGDFYWLEKQQEQLFFAAADCTGHGVPGAMVSVVCANSLSKALLEENLTTPGKLLDRTRELVVQRFEKSGEDVKDGMDISLCSLNFSKKSELSKSFATLQWAGANNPLWIIRNNELIEYKANKQPIGKVDNPKPFTTHTIDLQKGDTIYIFTDGFADQFGGEKGKKLMYKPFKELLLSIQDKTMDEQKELLEEHFENWKGNLEQVDDVCVIGVRI